MKIGNITIGQQPFIIAEVGLNHNGSVPLALEMVDRAAACGVDAVKFQTFRADQFCSPSDPLYPDFKRSELPDEAWPELKGRCDQRNVVFMSTPQNPSDLDLLLPLGIEAIKVGSDDCVNLPLLKSYARHSIPLIVSTGMALYKDLLETMAALNGVDVAYLLCTSQYPCPDEEARMGRLHALKIMAGKAKVGFSDHTMGNEAACMAVAKGACIFEKHFTLDHDRVGPDHRWACDPVQLESWVIAIRRAWKMRGTWTWDLTPAEEAQRIKYQRRAGQQLRGEAA